MIDMSMVASCQLSNAGLVSTISDGWTDLLGRRSVIPFPSRLKLTSGYFFGFDDWNSDRSLSCHLLMRCNAFSLLVGLFVYIGP